MLNAQILPATTLVSVAPDLNLPADNLFTTQNAGADNTVDSDVDPTTSRTAVLSLATGEQNVTIDAGVYNPPVVVGRNTFYNNSLFDGNNPADNSNDDHAIATHKVALRPSETASFANYTSYRQGINGVMIDVDNLFAPNTLTVADFDFFVGNNSDPSTWQQAPTPTLTIRENQGMNGSDRFVLIWQDQAITNTWLQVRLLANANTKFINNDVFYFGNAVGEAGNSISDANVNATDQILARSNGTSVLNALKIITVPNQVQAPPVVAGNQAQSSSILALALASVTTNLNLTVVQIDHQTHDHLLPSNGVTQYLVLVDQ